MKAPAIAPLPSAANLRMLQSKFERTATYLARTDGGCHVAAELLLQAIRREQATRPGVRSLADAIARALNQ